MTDQEKIRAIIKKVWTQAEPSAEGKLAGSVIELSLRDLVAPPSAAKKALNRKHQDAVIKHNKVTARMFLTQWIDESPIQHISSTWINKLFKQAGCLYLLEV